jgi:hypothetical protein
MDATSQAEPFAAGPVADSEGPLLRRWLIAISGLAAVGTVLELLLLRHWDNGLEVIPFVSLAALGVAIAILAAAHSPRAVHVARLVSSVVAASGAIGVFIHVRANYEAAPLDFRFTDSWQTTAELIRWLLAATDTVGPSPTLAPAALTFAALALLAATLRHPALAGARQTTPVEHSENPPSVLMTP